MHNSIMKVVYAQQRSANRRHLLKFKARLYKTFGTLPPTAFRIKMTEYKAANAMGTTPGGQPVKASTHVLFSTLCDMLGEGNTGRSAKQISRILDKELVRASRHVRW